MLGDVDAEPARRLTKSRLAQHIELARSVAALRGRNAEWAESAVRDAESVSAEEALELGVIDLVATDVPSLLAAVDGTVVELAGGSSATLDLMGATVEPQPMGSFGGFLHALLDPNLAFIVFWLGLALIVAEFFVPGGIAGTLGALMFVGSLVALGMLPVQLIGVVLLAASVVFFVLELLHPGVGVPAIAGVVSLVLGGLFLFDMNTARTFRVCGDGLTTIVREDHVCLVRRLFGDEGPLARWKLTLFRRRRGIWRRDDVTILERAYRPPQVKAALVLAGAFVARLEAGRIFLD